MKNPAEEPKVMYTWKEFDRDILKIAAWARRNWKFTAVYGVPRGGLVLAVKLSHLLGIPLLLSRDDITRDTLVVDDIIDQGKTIGRLIAMLGDGFHVASLFYNPKAKYAPDFFVNPKTGWMVFPWETRDSSKYDKTKF